MTEWEQMKKEYRDVQIPASGPHQMLETIAKAKRDRKRRRIKQAVRYSTIVAAAVLVLLIPGAALFSGGFRMGRDTNETAVENNMAFTGSGQESTELEYSCNDAGSAEYEATMRLPASKTDTTADSSKEDKKVSGENTNAGGSNGSIREESGTEEESQEDNVLIATGASAPEKAESAAEQRKPVSELLLLLSEKQKDILCGEISQQIEERRQQGEEYYTMYDIVTKEVLLEGQSFYIREDGLLVIEYAPGIIAPESMGEISFVIPEEIISIEEMR